MCITLDEPKAYKSRRRTRAEGVQEPKAYKSRRRTRAEGVQEPKAYKSRRRTRAKRRNKRKIQIFLCVE